MINLKAYSGDPMAFHRDVVRRKRNKPGDAQYKNRLNALDAHVLVQYGVYKSNFDANTLPALPDCTLSPQERADLLSLYDYKRKKIQELKITLTTTDRNRKIPTCQNCTLNEVGSLDHIVPKEDFSSFSVHPHNLFPSCSKCNSYKGKYWRNGGEMLFLNLYLDTLPSEQYLYVDLKVDADAVVANFSLQNNYSIDPDLFSLIESHYPLVSGCLSSV